MLPPTPKYNLPVKPALAIAGALLTGRSRSFRRDSARCLAHVKPPPEYRRAGNIPSSGPFLLATNHYSRPRFNAAWMAIAVSGAVPVEIHWLITSAWTFPGRRLRRPARWISEWALGRLAKIYGFTSMPPMPPDPDEVERRAQAVRRLLSYARSTPAPAIGLAPEGRDAPGGCLCAPPPGAGRFIAQLLPYCRRIIPAGVYEEGGCLCVQFGEPYALEIPSGLSRDALDRHVSQQVMAAIAAELPHALRGEYQ